MRCGISALTTFWGFGSVWLAELSVLVSVDSISFSNERKPSLFKRALNSKGFWSSLIFWTPGVGLGLSFEKTPFKNDLKLLLFSEVYAYYVYSWTLLELFSAEFFTFLSENSPLEARLPEFNIFSWWSSKNLFTSSSPKLCIDFLLYLIMFTNSEASPWYMRLPCSNMVWVSAKSSSLFRSALSGTVTPFPSSWGQACDKSWPTPPFSVF